MSPKKSRVLKVVLLCVFTFLVISSVMPQNISMPVVGATNSDYNANSFWAHPWGKSVTHKGVDIFAKKGTTVKSPVRGRVVRTTISARGGKSVIIMDRQLRYHYLAHLDTIMVAKGQRVSQKSTIGKVGNSGNAAGKPPHLHYAIVATLPHFWKIDKSIQGWKKAFYLNPIPHIKKK
jgi:peptidoglycan LD-endopeptidase LytH